MDIILMVIIQMTLGHLQFLSGSGGYSGIDTFVNPDLNRQQVKDVIKQNMEKSMWPMVSIIHQDLVKKYGYGKIDAEKAVKKAT